MNTVKQTACRLSVSARFVYRLCSSGQIEHFKLGSTIRISDEAIERYLASQKQGLVQQVATPAPRVQLSVLKLRG